MSNAVAERAVAEAFRERNAVGAEELESLLSSVLAECAGYHPRALNGFLVERQVHSGASIEVRGLAILVEHQSVEPTVFTLMLNAQGEVQSGSNLRFGLVSRELVTYGSTESNRLSKRLLSEPPQVEQWAHEFVRTADGWQSMHGVA